MMLLMLAGGSDGGGRKPEDTKSLWIPSPLQRMPSLAELSCPPPRPHPLFVGASSHIGLFHATMVKSNYARKGPSPCITKLLSYPTHDILLNHNSLTSFSEGAHPTSTLGLAGFAAVGGVRASTSCRSLRTPEAVKTLTGLADFPGQVHREVRLL